jgi:hypothetical protein
VLARKYRSRASTGIFVIAVVFTLLCVVLPEIRTEQIIVRIGPSSPYGETDYTFSGYVIPPVPAGSQIAVAIQGYLPYSLTFSLFPAAGGDLNPTGPALMVLSNFTGAPSRVSVKAPVSGPYAIFISSTNRIGFAIGIKGTWSLFYVLRGYVFAGFFVSVASGLAAYYYRQAERKKEIEEKAIREMKNQETGTRGFRLRSSSP